LIFNYGKHIQNQQSVAVLVDWNWNPESKRPEKGDESSIYGFDGLQRSLCRDCHLFWSPTDHGKYLVFCLHSTDLDFWCRYQPVGLFVDEQV